MKKVLSYMLLVVYTTLLVKPVLPFIIDTASHIFNYSEHKATVHSENGKYHVHYELQQNEKKSNPQKESGIVKKDVSENEYIINNEVYNHSILISKAPFAILTCYPLSAPLNNNYPPPKV
jgi:hypothetical protein